MGGALGVGGGTRLRTSAELGAAEVWAAVFPACLPPMGRGWWSPGGPKRRWPNLRRKSAGLRCAATLPTRAILQRLPMRRSRASAIWTSPSTPPAGACSSHFLKRPRRISSASPRCNSPGRSCRSEEHTSELQSLMRISYAVFCLKKKTANKKSLVSLYTHIGEQNKTEEI